jgi:hypothetical protein
VQLTDVPEAGAMLSHSASAAVGIASSVMATAIAIGRACGGAQAHVDLECKAGARVVGRKRRLRALHANEHSKNCAASRGSPRRIQANDSLPMFDPVSRDTGRNRQK